MKINTAINKFMKAGAPKQYGYPVKKYLHFVEEKNMLIDEQSAARYFEYYSQDRQLSYNITSPIQKFLAFARQEGIKELESESRLTEPFSMLLEGFLNSEQAPGQPTTRAAYARQLKKYLIWVANQDEVVSYQTVSGYLQHLQQTKSLSTSQAFLTAIKKLAQWAVLHSGQVPNGSVSEPVEALGQVYYLKSV